MEELEKITVADMETISNAVLQMIKSYPELPATLKKAVLWQYLDKAESLGIYTMTGAVYLKKYISGSYIAQFPFRIIYKCNPTTNNARMTKQNLLDKMGRWLEESCGATFKDAHITIQSIERTSMVYKQDADSSGYELYMCTMNIKYMYKKGW